MPVTAPSRIAQVMRLTLLECFGSTGMLTTLALLVATMIAGPVTAPFWLDGAGPGLAAAAATLVSTLVVLMSFTVGPLSRDFANGTTMVLVASAVTPAQIIIGTAAALELLALPPALLAAVGMLATTGAWATLTIPIVVTAVLLSPLTAAALAILSIALALWKGSDTALIAPWTVIMSVGATLVFLVTLNDMDPLGWGTAAVFGVAAICTTLLSIAIVQTTARSVLTASR